MAKRTQKSTKARPFGRSLADFTKLNDAEKEVIAAAREGRTAFFGNKIPETDEEKKMRTIRAGLVRFLALGGDDTTPVHERGVWIQGALVDGLLDFHACKLAGDFALWNCELAETLYLQGARASSINLADSRCQDIVADRVKISGGLFLCGKFVALGEVRLLGAEIVGNLDCSGGRFEGRDNIGDALSCDGIRVGGVVFLHDVFTIKGAVRLVRAEIRVNLECDRSRFEGRDNHERALNCDGIQVDGAVFLRDNFVSIGAISMCGATIGAEVNSGGGNFGVAAEQATEILDSGSHRGSVDQLPKSLSLDLSRATVKGTLWLGGLSKDAKFYGGVDLTSAKVDRIVDAVTKSTKHRELNPSLAGASDNPTFLHLDGLTYDRFGESTDLTAPARSAFLRLQRENDLGKDFKPQPWMQMIKVLRESGHTEAAREVAIEFEKQRRRAGKVPGLAVPLHYIYGLLVGYGHRPMKLVGIMLFVWSISAILYQWAAENGWFAPTDPHYFQDETYKNCRPENGGNWITCSEVAPEYTRLNALAYSLDVILPLVDLQQEKEWAPIIAKGPPQLSDPAVPINGGVLARLLMWFEVLFGWLSSAMLAAVLTGLAKRVD
jgi:hypothetical protein